MTATILTLHTLIVLGLIVVVLLQRSDGGALGIGGGGGGGGFMSGRGAANALTRTTSVLAAIFFATSLGLAVMAGSGQSDESAIEDLTGAREPVVGPAPEEELSTDDLLNSLGGDTPADTDAAAGNDATTDTGSDAVSALETVVDDAAAASEEAAPEATQDAASDVLDAIGSEPAPAEQPEKGSEEAETEDAGEPSPQ